MLILLMSIADSIPVLACLILLLMRRDYFFIQCGLRLLKLGIFFFLVPFQSLRVFLPDSIYFFTAEHFFWASQVPSSRTTVYHHIQVPLFDGSWLWVPKWLFYLTIIWLVVFTFFFFLQIKKYRKSKKVLLCHSIPANSAETSKKFQLRTSSEISSPYSFGFLRSCIILPKNSDNQTEDSFMLKHEQCHVLCYDSIYKLLCLVIICIHFFNPFSYLLLAMYSQLCELRCDQYVVKNLSADSCRQYGMLLLNLSAKSKSILPVWHNPFSIDGKLLKWRLRNIMQKRTFSKPLLPAFIISLLLFLTSSATTFAYMPLQHYYSYYPLEDGTELTEEFGSFSDPIAELDFSHSDLIFQSDDGTIEFLDQNTILGSPRFSCKTHTYQNGTLSDHQRNSNGGCIVTQYNVRKCSKCGSIADKTRIVQCQYDNCPH